MDFKLPFKLYNKIGVCPDIFRLSALLTDEKYLPWFVEQFMGLYMNCDFATYYHNHECLERHSMYDEVLSFDSISKFDEICVITEMKNAIKNGGYLVAILDFYYIEQSKSYYHTNHIVHDTLIYGFDDVSESFYYYDGVIGESKLPFSQFLESFQSARKIFVDVCDRGTDKEFYPYATWYVQNLPLSVFYPKEFSRKTNLARIYHLNNQFLKGAEVTNETAKRLNNKNYMLTYFTPADDNGCIELLEQYKEISEHASLSGNYIERYGTAIYKGYYDDLYNILMDGNFKHRYDNSTVNDVLIGMDYLMRSKDMLAFRLEYLHKEKIIAYDADLMEMIQDLRNKINTALNIFLKFTFVEDKDYIEDFRKAFIEIEKLDIVVLERFRRLLYDTLRVWV